MLIFHQILPRELIGTKKLASEGYLQLQMGDFLYSNVTKIICPSHLEAGFTSHQHTNIYNFCVSQPWHSTSNGLYGGTTALNKYLSKNWMPNHFH